ncbi:MAG: GDP-L-fucose synthase [Bacteroidetes bacterium]|nr:GDP-L-fucose synthase [Bacteroidota bacterium]
MEATSKIYIAGHMGMVGSAISRKLRHQGFTNIIGRTLEELDLTSQQAVADFFEAEKPEYIVLAAAKVGGILANDTYRAQFIYENLMIEANIIHQAYLHGVKKLLFLGSSCIYPKNAPQPLKEEYLLTGELEQTNEPYAIAKIAGIKLCESYYRQYGCNFISVMPTNLYGPNDNYNLETSHVLPAIIRKMHLAQCLETANWEGIRTDLDKRPIEGINGNSTEVEILNILKKYGISLNPDNLSASSVTRHASRVTLTLWGTGQVFREFLHVDDMASACVKILEELNTEDLITRHASRVTRHASPITAFINIGTGEDQTIAEIASLVRSITGYTGDIRWDNSKPDGTLKKLLDVSMLKELNWSPHYSLHDGILSVYKQYIDSKRS